MPKKFKEENSKSVIARARKAAVIEEETARKQAELEDAYWKDDDKHINKKSQRKQDREKKKQDTQERKLENKKLAEEEMESLKNIKVIATKMTRAEIQADKDKCLSLTGKENQNRLAFDDEPLEENVNRITLEEEARNIDEAINVLSSRETPAEKHPEKRMKAAYRTFEDANLPSLREENPNMRLSQIKQMLKKDWMKSPDNPMNQRTKFYNEK